MIKFTCDYTRTAAPEVLQSILNATAQYSGYSEDELTQNASQLVRQLVDNPDVAVHFLLGGTQTNSTLIAAALRTHQSVIAASSGHINVHETGAIEASGHKVTVIPTDDGKLTADSIDQCLTSHTNDPNYEHIVQPAMVYISNPTELGTLYSLKELTDIADVCRRHNVLLYLDGARLGYGLASPANDLTLKDICRLTDAFYIGGTKCGALFGEALVIRNEFLKRDFRYIMKQRGALLAKGFLLGAQFSTLFGTWDGKRDGIGKREVGKRDGSLITGSENRPIFRIDGSVRTDGSENRPIFRIEHTLYYKYSLHAIHQARLIRQALLDCNIPLLLDSPTNQLFPLFPEHILRELQKNFEFDIWSPTLCRIATDWSTRDEDTAALISSIIKGK